MIYLILPMGHSFGWGVCGKYLVKEISQITEVKHITEKCTISDIGDELDFYFLKSKLAGKEEVDNIKNGVLKHVDCPILHAISNHELLPGTEGMGLRGTFNAGYTFFEESILQKEYIQNGRDNFDIIIAGSKWCEDVLRKHGLEDTTTIIQGIDPQLFNPFYSEKVILKDHFVVFSGGKFELRKGQDIVIKAYKYLQDKYQDVILVNSWFNFWTDSMKTMAASPHIKFEITSKDYVSTMNKILLDNDIDLDRVITLTTHPNALMARIYKNTDIGLFPNRCEGGTNLVLMEYMACGKPVIASYSSGHKDILNAKNSVTIDNMKPINLLKNGIQVAVWDDPDLDETINHLEWAYQNREKLKSIGTQAGNDLSQLTWKRSAEAFLKVMNR
jgi:glycosyltransferase involved in cell wall biosynthesis